MSFFSFQDIIACTTGIMVLFTLLLTLMLLSQVLNAADENPPADLAALKEALAERRRERDRLAKEVAAAEQVLAQLSSGRTITRAQVIALDRIVKRYKVNADSASAEVAKVKKKQDITDAALRETERIIAELAKAVVEMQAEKKRRAKSIKVTLLGGKPGGKSALFVECSASSCVVARIPRRGPNEGTPRQETSFTGAGCHQKFAHWASRRDSQKEYFVLLMRPDAADVWLTLVGQLQRSGFDVGWDVWPADKTLTGGT